VINSKLNTPSQPIRVSGTALLTKNNNGIGVPNALIQNRAYELYEVRGKIDGFAEQDWYKAETDLRGNEQNILREMQVHTSSNKPMKGPHTV
jgi:hypothetical protein